MGYTTEFEGAFKVSPPLSSEQVAELVAFSEERHGGGLEPFEGFPGFWCEWAPNEEGTELSWNGAEKFYDYVPWLKLLIERFFEPWGKTLSGKVRWYGEDRYDAGVIVVTDNVITTLPGRMTYGH